MFMQLHDDVNRPGCTAKVGWLKLVKSFFNVQPSKLTQSNKRTTLHIPATLAHVFERHSST